MTRTPEQKFDPGRLQSELSRLIASLTPSRILCVGEPAESLLAPAVAQVGGTSISTLPLEGIPDALDELGRYDLAYVHGVLERLSRPVGGMLLARLRDVSAEHLLVHVEIGSGGSAQASTWENNDLLAFGLVQAGVYRCGSCRAHIYQFNIFDYKLTPEWFSPKDWAHPHLWEP